MYEEILCRYSLKLVWENGFENDEHFIYAHEKCEEVIEFVYLIKGASTAQFRYNEGKKRGEWYSTLSKWHPFVLKLKEVGWRCPNKIYKTELIASQ